MSKHLKNLFNPVLKDIRLKVKSKKDNFGKSEKVKVKPDRNERNGNDDMEYFRQAMADVAPLPFDERKVVSSKNSNIKPAHSPPDDEAEAINHLRNLVDGHIDMDITFSDEYLEGAVPGVSRKVMRKLKRGQIPVQDHIDLHGLTKAEAEVMVRNYIIQSHRRGYRCVLIVHGRGLNSPDQFPILKEMLPKWLNQGPARKIVLAFASSQPYDGGTGAIYVLLRRR